MLVFRDQVVVITGAAGNLGHATAHAFAEAGAKLVLVGRPGDRLQNMYQHLLESTDCLLAAPADLTDEEAVGGMVAEVMGHYGRLDVLVNAAGGYRAGTPVHETSLATWDFLMDLNAKTCFVASRAVIPVMLKQGRGWIINVAASVGLASKARMGAYAASKSAVLRLTEAMAAELKRKGINVNCVLPGTIDTPENRAAMPEADHSRWVMPADLAQVILFLASEAARAVHGAAVPVYGTG